MALAEELWIVGARMMGSAKPSAVHVRADRIVSLGGTPPPGAKVIDAAKLVLAPAVLDAHVHLAFAGEPIAVARQELRCGIAAVLDLGAPEGLLRQLGMLQLKVVASGPLLTAPRGYPTQSWGAGGYGLELSSGVDARAAVARLAGAGVRFIKLAFDPRFALLAPEVARAAADEAHRRGLLVAAHALDAGSVRRALEAGADVLGHTPIEPLPPELLDRAARLTVISTLQAFGAGEPALENLRQLHARGARIVYGTDLGNEGTAPGIDARELALLARAGLSPAEVIRAATESAAALLGLGQLGRLAPGAAASLLALPEDPLVDPAALARPAWVLIEGVCPE
jgi:imidazolonepropionase-like amidohydrolase